MTVTVFESQGWDVSEEWSDVFGGDLSKGRRRRAR